MSSSGAQAYLASVTFPLMEKPGIKTVDFIFAADTPCLGTTIGQALEV